MLLTIAGCERINFDPLFMGQRVSATVSFHFQMTRV
jgi:hypothetical protein